MKIMIVDDEPKIRRGMKTLLEEQDGFEVIGIYDNAMSSLLDMAEKQPNVLITDIKMPEYSGLDLIEKIREKDKNLYIIILSGYGSFKYAQRAIRSGVYRYLTKPTNPRELISVLREIELKIEGINRTVSKSEENESVEVGNLLIRKALDYIELHYAEKIGLKTLSDALYISPNYFSDLFRRHMKVKFSDFLIEYRLKKACILLKKPEYKVSEIAEMVGFRDSTYFSTVFKKTYNLTPLEYKNTKN
ncbi:response regulator transcription factor [Oribacterium parvum]|jgi:response regulator|uniref:response regulator transcription factor n=1 Tax=Oribacterium parvum TaxID=1501329 RepID=UPI0028DBB072|nr:response regulator [Oribacterium parvum]